MWRISTYQINYYVEKKNALSKIKYSIYIHFINELPFCTLFGYLLDISLFILKRNRDKHDNYKISNNTVLSILFYWGEASSVPNTHKFMTASWLQLKLVTIHTKLLFPFGIIPIFKYLLKWQYVLVSVVYYFLMIEYFLQCIEFF